MSRAAGACASTISSLRQGCVRALSCQRDRVHMSRMVFMRALTVDLARAGSLSLSELPDPEPGPGELLVEGVAIGICGTDREIARGEFGVGETLVIGHESLG